MKKIKEKRTEKLTANVSKTFKAEVLEFAENYGELSESKAVAMLVKKGLEAYLK